jgi:hypothetical protein
MARVQAEELPAVVSSGAKKRGGMVWLRRTPPVWRAVTAAVLIAAVVLGGYFEHRHQRQLAGERARDQVLLALQITSSALQNVRSRLNEIDQSGGSKAVDSPIVQELK